MKSIFALAGVFLFVIIGFAAGYFLGSNRCKTTVTQSIVSVTNTPTFTQAPTPTTTSTPTVTKAPETELMFTNYNSAAVASRPTSPTTFTTGSARKLYLIQDYHWNGAKGKTPGTIALKSADGKEFGPWEAKGDPGQGGVPDAYWTVYPDVEIPAGTYTVIDSDPASWAQNSGTKGTGMSQVYAVK